MFININVIYAALLWGGGGGGHLLFDCSITNRFRANVKFYIFCAINLAHNFVLKDIICYCKNPKHVSLKYVNFFILYATFVIHKQKMV